MGGHTDEDTLQIHGMHYVLSKHQLLLFFLDIIYSRDLQSYLETVNSHWRRELTYQGETRNSACI